MVLELQWSPAQISGWLKQEFEAIYRSLFIQARGVLKKERRSCVRRGGCRPKSHNAKSGQGHILDMVFIRKRPAEIEDRAVPGHWEGDLLTGANDTHIATLVERNTRFTMLVKIPRNDSTTVVAALAKQIGKLPDELQRSLTWDQSKEMAAPVLRGYVTIRHTVKAAGRGNAATSITATGEGAQGREVGERRHLGRQPGHRAAA